MIQYWICKRNSIRFMRYIYKTFLMEDKDWHFFYEGTYMLIRMKARNRKIEKYLKAKRIKHWVSTWSDPHSLVRKHQDLFKDMFHAYSVLAMTVNKKDFSRCLNRVIHCFCNMSWESMSKHKQNECTAVAHHLMNTAYGQGRMDEQKISNIKFTEKVRKARRKK